MGFFSKLFGKTSPAERARAREQELIEAFPVLRQNAARRAAEERDRKAVYYVDTSSAAREDAALEGKDEAIAQKIKKLLLSASFHESRDPRAFKNLSTQLEEMGNSIRANGQEHWYRINRRVKILSGEHWVGISQYYDLLGDAPEASGPQPED